MKIFLFVTLSLLGISPLLAATYTTAMNGDWEMTSTWVGGNKPPDNIPAGNMIVINHTVEIQTSIITNHGTLTLNSNAGIFTRGISTFINNGTIMTPGNATAIFTFDSSNFTNNETIIINNMSALHLFQTSTFVNNGTITFDDLGHSIFTFNTSSFTNNGVMTLGSLTALHLFNTSTFVNNGTLSLNNSTSLRLFETSTLLTCDPAPVFNPIDGSMIIDGSGGTATLAPVPAGNPCNNGAGVWDGNCNCVSSIPTLSQWGLIILGLFMAIFGVIAVRQTLPQAA